jgi:hypothetical protein
MLLPHFVKQLVHLHTTHGIVLVELFCCMQLNSVFVLDVRPSFDTPFVHITYVSLLLKAKPAKCSTTY